MIEGFIFCILKKENLQTCSCSSKALDTGVLRCGSQAREQLREAQENDSSGLERSYNTNVFPTPQADNHI